METCHYTQTTDGVRPLLIPAVLTISLHVGFHCVWGYIAIRQIIASNNDLSCDVKIHQINIVV